MIDRAYVYVKGGDGGNGVISFRHEKYVPFGGPSGGDGGDGGSVYLLGDGSKATLLDFRYKRQFRAGRGAHGKGKEMHGRRGEDLLIRVPLGTLVRRREEGAADVEVADVVEEGQKVLVARGGRGGWGNARFATPTDQAPRRAHEGRPGEEASLILDLKLIADVGVVGLPNAGKSTLVSTVSRARPKVADYPFTTLEPVLGVVEIGFESFVIADIPGIIEGAHSGRGLGLDFLRHVERTKVLVHLVDGGSDDLSRDLKALETELAAYEVPMTEKPRIIAVNKIDRPEVRARLPELRKEMKRAGSECFFISAATGEGVDEVMKKALELVALARAAVPGAPPKERGEEFKVFRPRPVSGRRGRKHG